MLVTLNNINKERYAEWSFLIKEQLISSTEFKEAATIGITVSRFPEVDTQPVIEAAWSMGKRVAVPKCLRRTNEMDFRLIMSYDDLEIVYLDLLEPIVSVTKSLRKEEIDLQIVPGVVYSNEGYRIGFGGGYYDRYLESFKGDSVSLAFECQTGHDDVPLEEHDLPVRKIFTEQKTIFCGKGGMNK